jgi:hypothetical protein
MLGNNECNDENLLFTLYKYADRQSENFTTASLVHLLRWLLSNESPAAADLLNKLSGGWLHLSELDCCRVSVASQKRAEGKQPDIEIIDSTVGRKAIVEVKLKAQPHPSQFEYAKDGTERLVFLTRYPLVCPPNAERPVEVRWYQVADWLRRDPDDIQLEISRYLINQFLAFLRCLGVTMERVDGTLFAGLPFLENLMTMIHEAVVGAGGRNIRKGGAFESIGLSFKKDQVAYWVGLYFQDRGLLTFQVSGHPPAVDFDGLRVAEHGFSLVPGGFNAYKKINLGSDQGFLNGSKEDQIRIIEAFVSKGIVDSKEFTSVQ